MTCEKAISEYCKQDKNQSLNFRVSMHLMLCEHCRRTILQMEKLRSLKDIGAQAKMSSGSIEKIMQKINEVKVAAPDPKNEKAGFILFFVITLVSVLPFIILPMLDIGKILIESLGIFFILPLALLCAFVVSILCALFVIKNTKYFIKRFLN